MKTIHRARCAHIGEDGDEKLKGHTVTIAGIGSVGSQVAEMLTREDVDLRLIDRGRVEEEDMGRLSIFQEEDITKFKVKQAKKRLELINPRVKIKSFHEEIGESNVFLVKSEMVIDATNQPDVNQLVFKHCQENKLPLIYIRYSGSKIKVLVANKKVPKKAFDWLADVGNVTEDGIYSGCVMFAGSFIINAVFRYFLGDTSSYQIEADTWNGKYKKTAL